MKIVRLVVCFAAALAMSLQVSGQDNFKDSGSTTLVITYRCSPAQRVELRKRVLQTGLARLQRLQAAGTLREYHVLFQPLRGYRRLGYALAARLLPLFRRSQLAQD